MELRPRFIVCNQNWDISLVLLPSTWPYAALFSSNPARPCVQSLTYIAFFLDANCSRERRPLHVLRCAVRRSFSSSVTFARRFQCATIRQSCPHRSLGTPRFCWLMVSCHQRRLCYSGSTAPLPRDATARDGHIIFCGQAVLVRVPGWCGGHMH